MLHRVAKAVLERPVTVRTAMPTVPVPSRLPLTPDGGFLLDTRPGARESWLQPVTLTDGRQVRLEVADDVDVPLLSQMIVQELSRANISRAIEAPYDALASILYPIVNAAIESRGSLLAFWQDKLVSCRCVHYVHGDDLAAVYGPPSPTPRLTFREDYLEAVRAAPFDSLHAKLIWTLMMECENQMGQFLPSEVQKLAFGEAVCTHDAFKRFGLGTFVSAGAEALARRNGCTHVANLAVARHSAAIAVKKGFRELLAFPFHRFVVAGERVFGAPMHDNAWAARIFLGSL